MAALQKFLFGEQKSPEEKGNPHSFSFQITLHGPQFYFKSQRVDDNFEERNAPNGQRDAK